MMCLGLDIGSLFTKAVLLEEEKILSSAIMSTTGNIGDEVEGLIDAVLSEAGVSRDRVDCIGITGKGVDMVDLGDMRKDDISCIGKAVSVLVPDARLVLDVGGQSITSILVDEEGGIMDFMRNDKCASGSGKFLEVMGQALGVKITEMDEFAGRATKKIPISSQCGVFVESELITHVNEGVNPPDIMAGICEAVAKIVISQALKFGFQDCYTYTGGVGKLRSVTESASQRIRGNCHEFPYDPQFASAIGAALFAEED